MFTYRIQNILGFMVLRIRTIRGFFGKISHILGCFAIHPVGTVYRPSHSGSNRRHQIGYLWQNILKISVMQHLGSSGIKARVLTVDISQAKR